MAIRPNNQAILAWQDKIILEKITYYEYNRLLRNFLLNLICDMVAEHLDAISAVKIWMIVLLLINYNFLFSCHFIVQMLREDMEA